MEFWERQFTQAQRDEMAKSGMAMPDGSFPISTEADLLNAMQAIGRAKDPEAAKAHIRKRAKAMGLMRLLTDAFKESELDAALYEDDPEFIGDDADTYDPDSEPDFADGEIELGEPRGKKLTPEERAARETAKAGAKAELDKAKAEARAQRQAARDDAKRQAAELRDKHRAERTALSTALRALRQAASEKAKAHVAGRRDSIKRDTSGKFSSSDRSDITGDMVPLTEAEIAELSESNSEFNVRIIAPGWGSSGYYPAKALEAAAKSRVFAAGTRMYWDHPTKSEDRERPERSLRDLAGQLVEDARWEPHGPIGPGLYARVRALSTFAPVIKELGPDLGVSIRALGKANHGQAEGRKGSVVESIDHAKSVDFVTAPGAGGRVVSLFESARTHKEDQDMDLEEAKRELDSYKAKLTEAEKERDESKAEIAKLKEAQAAQETELARFREAAIVTEARAVVAEHLKTVDIPAATKERLTESISRKAVAKDGKLDRDAFKAIVEADTKAELEYLESLLGKGKVRGFGGGSSSTSMEEATKGLDAAFAELGLSENERKTALAGR